MAQNYKAGLIITGDASGGIRAIKATEDELGKLNQGFDRGSRQSKRFGSDAARAGQQLTEIDKGAGVATRGLQTLQRAAAPIAGVIAGMFAANTIKSQVDWGDQLQKTNLRIGASTEALSQYNYVAKLSGVEFGQLTTAWQRQTRRISEAAQGTGVAVAALDRLSLSAKDLNRLAPEQQFERIAAAMQGVEDSSERVRLAQQLWDSEGVKLVQIVNQGTDAIAQMRAEADALGLTISQDTANAMASYNDEMDRLKFAAQGVSQTLAAELVPSMTAGLQATNAFIQQVGGAEAILDTATDAATMLAVVMGGRLAGALVTSTKSMVADTTATIAKARADATATTAARAKAAETLRVAQADQAAASRALASGHAIAIATGNTTLRTKAITQMAAANQRAVAAEAAHTAAINVNSAAMARGTVAAQGMAAATRTGASALALIGGPTGAALIAGAGLYYFREELGLTDDKMQGTIGTIESLGDSFIAEFGGIGAELVGGFRGMRAEMLDLDAGFIDMKASAVESFSGIVESSASVINMGLIPLQNAVNALDSTFAGLIYRVANGLESAGAMPFGMENVFGEQISRLRGMADGLMDGLIEPIGLSTELLEDNSQALRAQADALRDSANEIRGNALPANNELSASYQTIDQWLDEIERGARSTGDSVSDNAPSDSTIEAWGKYNDKLRDSMAALRDGGSAMAAANRAMDSIGDDVNDVMRGYSVFLAVQEEAFKDNEKAQKAAASASQQAARTQEQAAQQAARAVEQAAKQQADALKAIQHEMDPLLADHATYVERLKVLDKALADDTITQEAYGKAVRWNAEQYTRAATGAEEYEKQTQSLIDTYDSHNQRAQKLRTELEQINQRYRTGEIDGDQYARMVGGVRDEMQKLAFDADPAAQEMARAWEEAGNRIDETFADAFAGAFDSFDDFGDQLLDGFKRLLAELAYQATLKPIVVQFTQGMSSMMGMGGGQGGGMQSMFSNFNPGMLQNGWDTVSGWWGGGSTAAASGGGLYANAATQGAGTLYGSAATGASQGGLYGNAVTGGVAQSGGGGWMGGSMQNYQGMGAVYNMGASLAGGYVGGEIGSSVTGKTANSNYGETAGSLVGSYWGPWGAAAGSAIGSFVDSLFGSNKKTYDFDFEQGGHYGVFGDRDSELGQFGLTALSDYKLGEQQDALQELLTSVADFDNVLAGAAIDERVDAMRASIEGFRHSGPEDLFDTRLREIINGSGAYVESAIAAIADPEQMADAFVSVLNLERIATSLNDQIQRDVIDHLEANTGDVQGTVGGLAQALDATVLLGNSVERLNLQFETTAEGAIHSAWALQEAAGGIDNMTAVNDAYYQAAFSETERLSNAQEDLFASLSSVTDQTPHTVEELRALVEAQNLNSAAGGELAYELMALAPALKETSTAVRQAIEQQYQDVLGRTPDAGGLEYWFDQVSSGAITLDDALEHMAGSAEAADYAASGAANSLDGMADALRAQEQLQRQLWQAQGNTDAIRQLEIDRLSDLETAEVDNLTALQRRIWAIEDENAAQQAAERAQQDRIRAIEQEANAWSRARNELAGFGNTINGWLANHDATEQGMGTPRDRLEASDADFWAQYEKAQQGDRNARQSITQFADRAIDNLQEFYASSDPGVNGIAEIRDAMERLPEMLSPEQFLAEEFRGIIGGQTGALVGAMDLNGDGTVSAIERAIAADWDSSDLLKNVLHQEMLRLGTTVLTDAQIRAALKPHATNAEIDRLIQRVDANGDGIVSAQELANARLSGLGAGIVSAMASEFDGIDVNASGLIDYDEFHSAFAGMASETTLDKLFWLMDKNGDGQISRLESIAASNMTIAELGLMRQEGDTDDIMGGNPSVIDDIVNKYPASDPTAGKIDAAYHDVLGKAAQGFQVNSWARWLEEKDSRAGQLHQAVAWANLPVGGREWLIERDLYGDGTVPKFANGGVFSNSIVNRPTMFDMGLMGEAGPEAIVPLSRGAGGRLGIDATGLMQLPDGPQQLPMPEMPPLPQFPALSHSDVVQVLNDVKRELVETRKENKRLLELIGDNTRDTADAVEEYGERAEDQRTAEIEELETISRNSNTRSVTT
ncbi:Phage tail length tape-measure protein 1 [Halomonas citrativorans]|uniref:Phage tail length tape-measure protein 1 n=1 Tax=Halomonas citrativorans TaxID=2742612 RepID=A0A1R4HWP4_9GAMM|nr:EF-hand domain-containing protein [Halomonas citrativorans]SJN11583.1 Phage tail length tape-measure protein 1 [Halomonas citrativorans]